MMSGKKIKLDHKTSESAKQGRTFAQWMSAGIGLTLSLAMLGLVGWRAIQSGEASPPAITISMQGVTSSGSGYLVEFVARNLGDETAAEVTVEGQLTVAGSTIETSSTTFNYVPGKSSRQGGMFFSTDPLRGKLQMRALGYSKP